MTLAVSGSGLAWALFSNVPSNQSNAFSAATLSAATGPTSIHPNVTGSSDGNVTLAWTATLSHRVTFDVQRAPASSPTTWATINGGGSGQSNATICTGSVPGAVSCTYVDNAANSTSPPSYNSQYVYQVVSVIGGWNATSGGDLAQSLPPTSGTETYLAVPTLEAVSAQSSSSLWAVGQGCTVLYSTGSTWTQQTVPSSVCPTGTTLYGVDADGGSPIVVGSSGVTFVCTASCTSASPTWTAKSTSSLGSPTLYAVSAKSSTSIWAVGPNCTVLYYNGTTWASQTVATSVCPTGTTLNTVSNANGSPLVAGNSATLFQCTGSCTSAGPTWSSYSVSGVSGSPNYYAVFVIASNEWVVGAAGTVGTCTGNCGQSSATWSKQISGTTNDLRAGSAQANNVMFAAGASGTIVSCTSSCTSSGTSWTVATSNTTQNLYAMTVPSNNTAWAVGQIGTIDRRSSGTWGTQSAGLSATIPTQYTLSGSDITNLSTPNGTLYTEQAAWPSGALPTSCTTGTTPSLTFQDAPTVPSGSWTVTTVVATVVYQANATPGSGAGFALLVSGNGGSTWTSYALTSPGTGGAAVTSSPSIAGTITSTTTLQNMRLCLVGTSGSGTALTTSVDLLHVDVN
ncbi:MAG: hypothetical protein ACYDA2_00405 [Acidimicrobiales bacterium]